MIVSVIIIMIIVVVAVTIMINNNIEVNIDNSNGNKIDDMNSWAKWFLLAANILNSLYHLPINDIAK